VPRLRDIARPPASNLRRARAAHPSPRPIAARSPPPLLPLSRKNKYSFKNGLCQLPVYRKPWEHVLSAMAGAAVFEYVSASEETMVRKIEERYSQLSASAAAAKK
jgi:hypothetical protein